MGKELQVRNAYRAQQWCEVIRQCRSSGLSNREFCRQNGISEKTYYYWLRKLRSVIVEEMTPQLVRLEEDESATAGMFHIQYRGAQMLLPGGTDVEAIAAVLHSLQRL